MMSDLDRMVDEALRSYSAPAPSSGWENRVIARAIHQRRSVPWIWGLTFAAAALAAGLLAPWGKHTPAKIRDPQPQLVRVEIPSIPPPPAHVLKKLRRTRTESVFPTPTPLTAEERDLADLAARSPVLLEDLFRWQEGPIEIQPIDIPALQIETNNEEY